MNYSETNMRERIKKLLSSLKIFTFFSVLGLALTAIPVRAGGNNLPSGIIVNEKDLGFKIPTFSTILTFLVRGFFVIAGLVALLYLLLGAISWITSGGNKENVDKARDKITNAVIGIILIVVVLAIIATLEQVVFQSRVCFGITCELTVPTLLGPPNN